MLCWFEGLIFPNDLADTDNCEATLIGLEVLREEIIEDLGKEVVETVNKEMEVLNRCEGWEDQLHESLMPCIGMEFNLIKEAYFFIIYMPKWKGLQLAKVLPIMIKKQIPHVGSYLFVENKVQREQMTEDKLE